MIEVFLTPVADLELPIYPRIFEKILNGPNGVLRGLGETDLWKNQKSKISWHCPFKGSLTRDFRLQVFFMNQFPPGPQVFHWGCFEFFRKFAEIFPHVCLSPVSMTPAIRCSAVCRRFTVLQKKVQFIASGKIYRRCCWHRWTVLMGYSGSRENWFMKKNLKAENLVSGSL